MSDNVTHPLTGTGTADVAQATDDVGGVHFVKVKLADGTADSSAMIPGTASEGLKVNPHHHSTAVTATWTDSTPDESTLSISTVGYATVALQVATTGGNDLSGGQLRFEGRVDGGPWIPVYGQRSRTNVGGSYNATENMGSSDFFQPIAATTEDTIWWFGVAGLSDFRVRLNAPFTGTDDVLLRMVATTVAVNPPPAWQPVTLEPGSTTVVTQPSASSLNATVSQSIPTNLQTTASGPVLHDSPLGSSRPVLNGGYASAAAPSDVSADADAVRAWFLRNGAQAVNLTAAGALIPGDATNGLDTDVTRMPATAAEGAALPSIMVVVAGDDGTDTHPLQQNDAGDLKVSLDGEGVTNAGTFAVQESGAALTALQLIDDPVATLGTTTYTEAATKGMIVGAVRRDADTTLVDTTNEVGPLQMDANGRLKVEAFSGETLPVSLASVPSHAVTNAGTFAVQDSEKVTDNAGFTDGATKVQPAGFVFDETAGTALTENDAAAARIDSKRAQVLVIEDATTRGQRAAVSAAGRVSVDASGVPVPVTDNSGSLTVDAPSGTPVHVRIGDGTLQTSVVDETGASAVDALAVGGGTPHDSVDSGNPVKIGMKAANALPTAVANNDRANAVSDLFGRQLVGHIDPAMQTWKSANYTSTQTGTTIWDPTSGKRIAITSIVIGSYATTSARLILWFGDNGDTTYTAGTDQLVLAASFAPSATSKPGLVFTPPTPCFCTTADRELHITTDAGMSVDIAVYGYEW